MLLAALKPGCNPCDPVLTGGNTRAASQLSGCSSDDGGQKRVYCQQTYFLSVKCYKLGDYPYGYTVYTRVQMNTQGMPFEGTVRTPPVVSGNGYCPQTAGLESQYRGRFVRKLATFQGTGVGKECNPSYFNPTGYPYRSRTLSLSFISVRYLEGSQILRGKPRLSEPFWNRYVYT